VASIRDIADRARVSIGTVDRVLHNRGRVSEKTRARVQRIIAEIGYKPNIFARNLSLSREFRFGILIPKPNQDSGFWRIPLRGIGRAQLELESAKVRVRYHHFDRYSEKSFESAFHHALVEKPDGLLIAPVLPAIAAKLVASIPSRIPYVFFDSTIPGAGFLSTISQDPYQSGLLAANLMKRMKCGDGGIAIVRVTPADFHLNERLRGFLSGIQSEPSTTFVEYEADSHGGEAAFRKVALRILQENKNLWGVYVSNAWTHPFAHYLNDQQTSRRVCIIGYDLVAKNQKYLEAGLIDFIISQRPGMQAYEGIRALYRHVILKDNVKKTISVPLDIVTRDNVMYYQD
jgi:LacI family transcriptional regulator